MRAAPGEHGHRWQMVTVWVQGPLLSGRFGDEDEAQLPAQTTAASNGGWAVGQKGLPWVDCKLSVIGSSAVSSGFGGVKGLQCKPLTALSQPGEQRLRELRQEGAEIPPGTIENWLEKRAKRLSVAQSNRYHGWGWDGNGVGDGASGQVWR